MSATLWPFPPNGAVLERLEWLTDTLTSDSGAEQRRRNRAYPRASYEFDTLLAGRARQAAENILYGQQAAEFLLPVWMDAEPLSAAVAATDTVLPVTTATRSYTAGAQCVLVNVDDHLEYELAVVQSVGGLSITVTTGLASSWPATQTVIAPVRTARMPDSISIARFTGAAAYGRLRFACTDTHDTTAASESTYRSYPIMTARPDWSTDIAQDYTRRTTRLDSGIGTPAVIDYWGAPALVQSHRWLADGRSAIHAMRQWLFARSGRLSAFWMPSWALDLTPLAPIGLSDTTIDVAHCGYTAQINRAIGRRDIRIETTAGAVYYRRITASLEVSATLERLSIDSALGAGIALADIAAISYLRLVRLDTDSVEIAWHRWDVAEAAFSIRGILNDL